MRLPIDATYAIEGSLPDEEWTLTKNGNPFVKDRSLPALVCQLKEYLILAETTTDMATAAAAITAIDVKLGLVIPADILTAATAMGRP